MEFLPTASNTAHSIAIMLLLSLVVVVPGSLATVKQQVTDDSLLTCMVPGLDGQSFPEETRRLSLQPGPSGTVWLPMESGFSRPGFAEPTFSTLAQFLAPNLDETELRFTSTSLPVGVEPPIAANEIVVTGSGDTDTLFKPDPDPTIPLESLEQDQRVPIMSFVRSAGLGRCTLDAEWTKLPDGYFPAYFAGSRCLNAVGESCSFPEGLQCEPDISTPDRLAFISVLRWDCCWSYIDRRWQWECGWRNVEIPIIVDCTCSCLASQPELR